MLVGMLTHNKVEEPRTAPMTSVRVAMAKPRIASVA
jgi:hypothetical protein